MMNVAQLHENTHIQHSELADQFAGEVINDIEFHAGGRSGLDGPSETCLLFGEEGKEKKLLRLIYLGPNDWCDDFYLTCDDDLREFQGSKFLGVDIASVSSVDEENFVHEICFLNIRTDSGVITVAAHNEHNGFYSGFEILLSDNPTMPPPARA